MKTILGLIGGGERDEVILRTALAAAVPLSAHLDFLHVHVTAVKAARYNRVDFAMGSALRNAMDQLETKAKSFSQSCRRACSRVLRRLEDRDLRGSDQREKSDREFS